MRIEQDSKGFFISKGKGWRESFFCFFVDANKSCWTMKQRRKAQHWATEAEAREAFAELRRRSFAQRAAQGQEMKTNT
jgi:hypothetical protein